MRRAAVAALVVLAACTSHQSGSGSAPTETLGGRTYVEHRPPGGSSAVVFVLHGASLTTQQTERYYHWDDVADTDGFTVVYPQGIDNAWNAGSCCGDAPDLGTDDVAFLAALVARFSGPRFMVGVSNGAMMTLRFACAKPGMLTGIGSVAGTFTSACDHPPTIPFIAIHGLGDSIVDYQAGPGTVEDGPNVRLPATETIERMEAADHCTDLHTTTIGPVHRTTGACAVEVITIDGAGHQWPGATIDAARLAEDGPANQPSTALDATRELWSFFATWRGVGASEPGPNQ